ncbi:MFS transporter, BT1 family [Cupriavidus necator]|uniref:MFS transporter n=1 Tax=Cupriavidus necator (strain ATCC 17699 / DSM 428 / KCTC 22496 / NCIMB 10442 / H16 / Stanier 337) TaxID=381666 RepID=Q0K2H1_CUPNH|nr:MULTISPECIES: MFS transporter [Cupriavidus]EON21113.1 major facilitator superfamily transporter BT1 family protein [Cupriavidus sp. GA3-3]KUE85596.1 MFS transporter [Cupriavidus necator]QCC03690.1 MFS transporter [Cupriavidus necator H16]QQB80747.1 MFS transporter [Cupriavidus necator]WKA45040.1 MFS transporter [Cupriavidus necator]
MPAASGHDGSEGSDRTLLYFGWLTLFIALATPAGYLVDIQTSYLLKNQLHATATEISTFRLVTGIPVYLAFVFGLARDQWNPLGLRDRGFFLIFAPATAVAFIWMAYSGFSYAGLVIGMLLAMLSSRFIAAAYQGLIALVGQEKLMSGRLSALLNVVGSVPVVAGAFASGYISDHLAAKEAFLLMAMFAFLIAVLALWKPVSVFGHIYEKPQARGTDLVGNVRRLVRHKAVYPAVLICFLWNFAPGAATPLQFYLSNELHASDSVYSYYNGIFAAAFVPTFLLYGFLCKKVSLNKLLWWGTIVAVPQMVPLAFIHSANLALVLAAPIGLMGGVATAAYFDLAMRSCPPGLQGTLMMLVDGVLALSARAGDLLGSWIYNSSPTHGFTYCVIATTVVYALILLLIPLTPKALIATRDGEPSPEVQA